LVASASASVKVSREEIEQLAKALRVSVPFGASGAAVFRLCLDRVRELAEGSKTPNDEALAALATFQRALGGTVEAEAPDETGRAPAHPDGC
jgi:hypothetical protein